MRTSKRRFISVLVLAGAGSLCAAAYAQQDVNQKPKKARSRVLEEVMVTAQKREESAQDVPITIAAFSAEELDARGITNPQSLKLITPSLVYDELVGYAVIYMRGVGADLLTPTAEPSVATYIDGVYLPLNHGLAKDFTPVERVEVLKGPQGTLFGRNATGGAINIVTVKPGDEWMGEVSATYGSYEERRAKAYVSGPLTEGLSFSLAGQVSDTDPYYDLAPQSPQDELQANHSEGINPRILWDVTEKLSVQLNAIFTKFYGTGSVINSQIKPTPLGLALGSTVTGPRETAFNEPGTIDVETDLYAMEVKYGGDFFDTKFIGSYQENLTDTRWDYDNSSSPAQVYFYPTNQFLDAISGELQFNSNENSPWSEKLKWVGGLYYYKASAGIAPIFVGANYFDSDSSVPFLGDLVDAVSPIADSLGLPLPASALNLVLNGELAIESYAAYLQLDWSLTENLVFIAGARYQTEDRELVKSNVGLATDGFNEDGIVTLIDYLEDEDYEIKDSDISPRLALQYFLGEDHMVYASASEAFKSATLNLVNVYTPPDQVDPEKTTAFEIGAKGTFFEGLLQYNTAVFRNEVDGIQTMILAIPSGGLITIINAAEAVIQGVEGDIKTQLFPNSIPGTLVLTASASYLDGEYKSFPEGAGFDPQSGLAFGPSGPMPPQDFSGNQTIRTPEFSGTLGLTYTIGVGDGDLEIGMDTYYNSGYYFDTQNEIEQPQYQLYNARVSYFYQPWNLRVGVNGQNLTDELYFTNIFATDFGHAATGAPPDWYSLSLRWQY